MKRIVLAICMFAVAQLGLQAQQIDECSVDPIYQDTFPGVYPLPYDPDISPDGGITDTACLNEYFQFVFTLVVSDTITINNTMLPIDSIVFDTEDAFSNLPEGIDYSCNPPTCSFVKNTQGCVVLYGKATNPSDVGDHDLVITATLFSPFTPSGAMLQFPNDDLAAGTYTLSVAEEGSPNCSVWVDVNEPYSQIASFRNLPNPFSGVTTLEIVTKRGGDFTFVLSDPVGRQLRTANLSLVQGFNRWEFDAAGLAPGMYIYSLSDGQSWVSGRMVVQ